MESPRKSVFISYAHKDDTENFVSRLGYALDMYMNAFWDVKLQAGPWSAQLTQKIKDCDKFLVVMSHTQQYESEWCQREIVIARNEGKEIIPIRRFENHVDEELQGKHGNQYADFTRDFDEGFKKLTYLITGERLTAWEYLREDHEVRDALARSTLPPPLMQEFGDWLIVTRLWPLVKEEVQKDHFLIPDPHTPKDVQYTLQHLREVLREESSRLNAQKIRLLDLAKNTVDKYVNEDSNRINIDRVYISDKVILVWDEIMEKPIRLLPIWVEDSSRSSRI